MVCSGLQLICPPCGVGSSELFDFWLSVSLLCPSVPQEAVPFWDFCPRIFVSHLQQADVCSSSLASAGMTPCRAVAAGSAVWDAISCLISLKHVSWMWLCWEQTSTLLDIFLVLQICCQVCVLLADHSAVYVMQNNLSTVLQQGYFWFDIANHLGRPAIGSRETWGAPAAHVLSSWMVGEGSCNLQDYNHACLVLWMLTRVWCVCFLIQTERQKPWCM